MKFVRSPKQKYMTYMASLRKTSGIARISLYWLKCNLEGVAREKIFLPLTTYKNVLWDSHKKQEAQLPLRNRASPMYFL